MGGYRPWCVVPVYMWQEKKRHVLHVKSIKHDPGTKRRTGTYGKYDTTQRNPTRTAQSREIDERPGGVKARDSAVPFKLVGRGVLRGGRHHADLSHNIKQANKQDQKKKRKQNNKTNTEKKITKQLLR